MERGGGFERKQYITERLGTQLVIVCSGKNPRQSGEKAKETVSRGNYPLQLSLLFFLTFNINQSQSLHHKSHCPGVRPTGKYERLRLPGSRKSIHFSFDGSLSITSHRSNVNSFQRSPLISHSGHSTLVIRHGNFYNLTPNITQGTVELQVYIRHNRM